MTTTTNKRKGGNQKRSKLIRPNCFHGFDGKCRSHCGVLRSETRRVCHLRFDCIQFRDIAPDK